MYNPIILEYLEDEALTEINVTDERFNMLTHINYGYGEIADKDGNVVVNWKNTDKLAQLKSNFNNIKFSLSIGGWAAGNFSESAETEEGRKIFSKTAIEIMKKYKFDGIDVRWEFPCVPNGNIGCHPSDKYNFTLLLETIRNDLDELEKQDNRKYLLSIAAGAGEYYARCTELDKVGEIVDYVNILTYDLYATSPLTGHHCSLYKSSKAPFSVSGANCVEMFIEKGVSANKIVYGIAFHGRMWSGVEQRGDGLNRRSYGKIGEFVDYTNIKNDLMLNCEYKQYWDDEAKAAYLFNGYSFISYEDCKSIKNKITFIKEKKLAGLFFGDLLRDRTNELLNTINEEIKE